MPNKITWKKGMRLTAEIFNSMDATHYEDISSVCQLASIGRCGLFPSVEPFEISVNVQNNIIEVVSLRCHGVTKSGCLVNIDFDSTYTNTFDTRIQIPAVDENDSLILAVKMHPGEWREINETFSEATYSFELFGENTIIDHDCLPIGSLINQYGWRLNETDFIPPCLYISSHRRYEELLQKAVDLLKGLFLRCLDMQECIAGTLVSSVWNAASSAHQRLDKERETLTPGQFYSIIQQFIGGFLIGCCSDPYISLENMATYVNYTQQSLNQRTINKDIERGLELCEEISIKMDAVSKMTALPNETPERPPHKPKPKPKQQPSQEPTGPGRKRWTGLEI